jgi:hypothetical protein
MTCIYCNEPILPGEVYQPFNGGRDAMHRECAIRSIAGSVGHQNRTCYCFGGQGTGDNETKTVRENAKLAAVLFDELNREPGAPG